MFNDWRIARPFGINLYVSGWFWILPVVVFATAFSGGGMAAAVVDTAAVLALFACVGLHELGHALAARGYGIRTRDITLYPIGGVARLERMPEKPSAEIAIALAGPAVNVSIALLLGGLMFAADALTGPAASLTAGHLDGFLGRLFWGNVGLVLFNLIPAFPMDGGRVLRAVLCWCTSRVTATTVAGWVGAGVRGAVRPVRAGEHELHARVPGGVGVHDGAAGGGGGAGRRTRPTAARTVGTGRSRTAARRPAKPAGCTTPAPATGSNSATGGR